MTGAQPISVATKGILLLVISNLCLAGMDAVSKTLIQSYDVTQILWVRYMFFAGFTAALAWRSRRGKGGLRAAFKAKRPWLNMFRAALLVVEIGLFVVAFGHMKLVAVHAIAAICPLMITALSALVLGEKVGPRRWAAVAAGFVGMLLILRPGFAVFDPWALLPLAGAALFAVYQILTKILGRVEQTDTIMLYTGWVGLVLTSFLGPVYWVDPDPLGWGLLVLAGLMGVSAHLLLIQALAIAEASVLQPFNYSLLVWASMVGFLIFGELPDLWTAAGAVIIVGSGLYVWWRERVRAAS